MSLGISSRVYPTASRAAILAIGKPVALDARADERLTRGFISITTIAQFETEAAQLEARVTTGEAPSSALRAFGVSSSVAAIDKQGRITLDETDLMLAEPGSCLRPADEYTPLIETFADELRYLLGEKGYRKLRSDT